jgi:hypothetical protein
MSNHSRRAFLAGCAIMPAAALPAIALASSALAPEMPEAAAIAKSAAAAPAEPDPILAAIAESRRVWAQYMKANRKFDNAKCEVRRTDPKPSSVIDITWGKYGLQGYSELADARALFLALPGADPETIEREYQNKRAEIRAGRRAEREWYKRNGLTELKAESDRLDRADRKALWALTRIKPTTPAGAGALVAYVHEDMKDGNNEWQLAAIGHAAKALKEMKPPAGISTIAAPALALSGAGPNPICAAIERHRAAGKAFTAMVDEQGEMETAAVPEDGPRWRDFERRYGAIVDQLNEQGRQLFEAPMSIAGLVALFEYMEEQRQAGNGSWDDAWSLPPKDKVLSALVGTVRRVGAVS